ncbi:MAG TPA: glycosyltransferase family 2 protein [bacterium]|jgi:hypothetical protein|nr:glycosyltransferase family 2 protein [bacterium]
MFKTPVAIFGFNRPEMIKRVFERVREVKPRQLLLVLDGPRAYVPADLEKCKQVKEILSQVDWPCDVKRDYAESNMGCRKRIASGISWVFENVEEAILLEDDCLPDLTFFPYCAELLEYYRHDTRVGMIAGHTASFKPVETYGSSYYVDRLAWIWGWATWRRAWKQYDLEMKAWPLVKEQNLLSNVFHNSNAVKPYSRFLDSVFNGKIDTWDAAWALTFLKENYLCIHPKENLVSNIGWGEDSTHTGGKGSPWANLPTVPMRLPLVHPISLIPDTMTEKSSFEMMWSSSLISKIKGKLKHFLNLN